MSSRIETLLLLTSIILMGSAGPALSATLQYQAVLVPVVVGSTGTGYALVTVDTDLNTMHIAAIFSGLSGDSTVAHIHCCTTDPGIGTTSVVTMLPSFTDWPTGVTSGSYDFTFDLASVFNAAFISANGGTAEGALAELHNSIISTRATTRAYFDIHSSTSPFGEIRGVLTQIPEPGTALLLGIGLGALAARPSPDGPHHRRVVRPRAGRVVRQAL